MGWPSKGWLTIHSGWPKGGQGLGLGVELGVAEGGAIPLATPSTLQETYIVHTPQILFQKTPRLFLHPLSRALVSMHVFMPHIRVLLKSMFFPSQWRTCLVWSGNICSPKCVPSFPNKMCLILKGFYTKRYELSDAPAHFDKRVGPSVNP